MQHDPERPRCTDEIRTHSASRDIGRSAAIKAATGAYMICSLAVLRPIPGRDHRAAPKGSAPRGASARRSLHKPLLRVTLVLQLQRPVFCGAVPGGYPAPEPGHLPGSSPRPPPLSPRGLDRKAQKHTDRRQDDSTAVRPFNSSDVPPPSRLMSGWRRTHFLVNSVLLALRVIR